MPAGARSAPAGARAAQSPAGTPAGWGCCVSSSRANLIDSAGDPEADVEDGVHEGVAGGVARGHGAVGIGAGQGLEEEGVEVLEDVGAVLGDVVAGLLLRVAVRDPAHDHLFGAYIG